MISSFSNFHTNIQNHLTTSCSPDILLLFSCSPNYACHRPKVWTDVWTRIESPSNRIDQKRNFEKPREKWSYFELVPKERLGGVSTKKAIFYYSSFLLLAETNQKCQEWVKKIFNLYLASHLQAIHGGLQIWDKVPNFTFFPEACLLYIALSQQ